MAKALLFNPCLESGDWPSEASPLSRFNHDVLRIHMRFDSPALTWGVLVSLLGLTGC